jgi:hypothetical protein
LNNLLTLDCDIGDESGSPGAIHHLPVRNQQVNSFGRRVFATGRKSEAECQQEDSVYYWACL